MAAAAALPIKNIDSTDLKQYFTDGINISNLGETCTPKIGKNDLCSFSNEILYSFEEAIEYFNTNLKNEGITETQFIGYFDTTNISKTQHILRWKHFKFFILKKGTILCHSTYLTDLIEHDRKNRTIKISDNCWWTKTFPGHSNYKGGWFTYQTPLGGPNFGAYLYYETLNTIAIPYIPNFDTSSPEYIQEKIKNEKFPDIEVKNAYINTISNKYGDYRSSHNLFKIYGPDSKHIYVKYDKDYYADSVGIELSELGFNGYISCDECEVYLSHKCMEYVLSYPINIGYDANHISVIGIPEKTLNKVFSDMLSYCNMIKDKLKVTSLKERNTEDLPKKIPYDDIERRIKRLQDLQDLKDLLEEYKKDQ